MEHVEIERRQLVPEMKFWIIIERSADVIAQFLVDRPTDHVAHRVKIEMKIERHLVVEAEAFVVNRVGADETKTESDDLVRLSPNKEFRAPRYYFRDSAKEVLR